jgi:hypothetical protein
VEEGQRAIIRCKIYQKKHPVDLKWATKKRQKGIKFVEENFT